MKTISQIQKISFIVIVIFGFILLFQHVYALKQYVNDEYNIEFEYPYEWIIIDEDITKYGVEYDKTNLLSLRPEQKEEYNSTIDPIIGIMLYSDMPDLILKK